MRTHRHVSPSFTPLLAAAGCAALLLGMAPAASAAPHEVNLASTDQAAAYCKSGSMGTNDIAYINSNDGAVQFGPGYKCVQKKAKKQATKKVSTALAVDGSGNVSECKLANAATSKKLCNNGGIGIYDIDYILGGLYKKIGGPGYGCGTGKQVGGIANAVCK